MIFLKATRDCLKANHKDVLIGEVWEDSSNKYVDGQWRPYIDGDNLTGTMNYPFRKFILDILRAESNLSEVTAMNQMLQVVENYPREYLQNCLNNLGTHDIERIKYMLDEDDQMVVLAFAMMFALPGVLCIYYGDEAGVTGKKNPDNRRFFPWGKENKFLQANVKHLAQTRKQNEVLVKGEVGLALGSHKHLGIVRYHEDQVLTTWLNWSDEAWQPGAEALIYHGLPDEIQDQILTSVMHFEVPAKGYLIK
ncbi:pullulanase [Ligilactobacillus equi]|uniref:alpha-amylase family glycosyl hydrolase n=1 Tax=Ligilactobacillus equi TaxID=137357 RepID=UPI002ED38ADA